MQKQKNDHQLAAHQTKDCATRVQCVLDALWPGKGNGKNPKLNGRDPTDRRKTQTPASKQTQTQSSTPQGLIQQEMHALT
jgi:hypothetical protein